ncbi:MAG: PIN domain-containing protein [Bacillota bacterium]
MKKITIDLNVILDFLNKRNKHIQAAKIMEYCHDNQVQGYICAHEITTLAYFLMKNYNNSDKVKSVINEFLDLFKIIPVSETTLRRALNSKINDYEDAVIDISSQENEIDFIVTRNLEDFKESNIKTVTPSEFIAIFNKS